MTTATGPYSADQLASAYGLSSLYEAGDLGAGQTVAVVELEPFDAMNVRNYDECYFGRAEGQAMASPPHLNVIDVDGKLAGDGGSQDVESTLDVEEISGFVPEATIDVYEWPNTNTGPLDVYNAIVSQDLAKVVSTSWGICEAQAGGSAVLAAEANLFEEAAAQGQTVVAASGDDGSSDCTDPSGYPLAQTAVDDPGEPALCDRRRRHHRSRPRHSGDGHHAGGAASADGLEQRRRGGRRAASPRCGRCLAISCMLRPRCA